MRTGIDSLPVDEAEFRARRMAEIDVFAHRQFVKEHGFLMNGRYAVIGRILRRRQMHRLAVDEDFTFIGLVNAGEDFHERGFACAVLADQCGHLTGIERDIDVIERTHTGKCLGNAAHFQNGLVRHGKHRLLTAGIAA